MPAAKPKLNKQNSSRRHGAGLLFFLTVCPLAWWLLFKPSGVAVELVAMPWRLEIEIEKLMEEGESSWCDEMPADASHITRRQIADPTGIRPEPTEHCRFTRPQWRTMRKATLEGLAPAPPTWPTTSLNGLDPKELGAERAGHREAFYELKLRNENGQIWSCRLTLAEWQLHKLGARYRVEVDRFGVADCSSLR
jgi:hypothetical protein